MLMTNFLGENLFDGFFNDFARPERRIANYSANETAVMRTDVKETDGGYELDVDLPGYKKRRHQGRAQRRHTDNQRINQYRKRG